MRENVAGSSRLASVIKEIAKGAQPGAVLIVGTVVNKKHQVRINGVVLNRKDYRTLKSVYLDELKAGDDVLLFKPNESLIVMLGKII